MKLTFSNNELSFVEVHEATHQGKYPMRCEICHKGFLKLSDLSVHKRTHSGEKPFICEICGKSFASVGNYNHHAKLHKQVKMLSSISFDVKQSIIVGFFNQIKVN